ncbi:MAG: hypothetical protein WA892_10290 [Ornithinimicrobium sp.]
MSGRRPSSAGPTSCSRLRWRALLVEEYARFDITVLEADDALPGR